MKLSTRARYGLKALIDLGLHSENETVSLQSIAERQDISVSYLEQRMAMLKKAGLVYETKEKNFVYYSLNISVFEEVMMWFSQFTSPKEEESNEKNEDN